MSSTATTIVKPKAEAVVEMLTGLLGVEITTREGPDVRPLPSVKTLVAEYRDDGGRTCALWISDLSLVCRGGGALALVPVEQCERSLTAIEADPALVANFKEIVNVGASIMNGVGGAHVKLAATYLTPRPLPPDIVRLILRPSWSLSLKVDVAGYGAGAMSLLGR